MLTSTHFSASLAPSNSNSIFFCSNAPSPAPSPVPTLSYNPFSISAGSFEFWGHRDTGASYEGIPIEVKERQRKIQGQIDCGNAHKNGSQFFVK